MNKALDVHKDKALAAVRVNSLTAAAPPDPFDISTWEETVERIVGPVILETLREFSVLVTDWAGLAQELKTAILGEIDLTAYLAEFLSHVMTLGSNSAELVIEELNEGVAKGEGIDKLTNRITEAFEVSKKDASRIARTETHNAAEGSKLESALTIADSGIRMSKEWVAHLDTRTRVTHARADAQEVMIRDDFSVGTAFGQRPGRMGQAKEDIACRCSLGYRVLGDDEPAPAPQTEAQQDANELRLLKIQAGA